MEPKKNQLSMLPQPLQAPFWLCVVGVESKGCLQGLSSKVELPAISQGTRTVINRVAGIRSGPHPRNDKRTWTRKTIKLVW